MAMNVAKFGRIGAFAATAFGLTVATLMTFAAVPSALAAPATERAPTKVADAGQALHSVNAVAGGEEDGDTANCSRYRRRLWVEGEGWIVRRITTCR